MEFEWDEAKSDANYRTRGIDFLFAVLVFDGPVVEHKDLRFNYGERRIVATGVADALHLTGGVHR